MQRPSLPPPVQAPGPDSSASVRVMRCLPFLELMELLEFSRLRLDPPAVAPTRAPGMVLGTQEWLCPDAADALPATQAFDVYVCSTLAALHDAVLPPDDTQLHFDMSAHAGTAPPASRAHRVRLCAVASARPRRKRTLPYLRVDLGTLIQRIVVPARMPANVFELVQQVVRTRLWIDVARA
ncbi:Uncharacterised protein [Bordetella ansorpii]|uniref:Uncharacterized protein n=1 Tax=Bordetella ansorpii TaxID=288768 RepID=A0A157SG69_9BORD|nr:hypothetical protein [Bordetella ansorpii]SAI69472.1 Uncharacterised protein [Bordetella ansorpii]